MGRGGQALVGGFNGANDIGYLRRRGLKPLFISEDDIALALFEELARTASSTLLATCCWNWLIRKYQYSGTILQGFRKLVPTCATKTFPC